jgi:hypothetical protein
LNNGEAVIGDAVRRFGGIEYLQIQHTIDANLNVVLGNADLFGNIDRLFFEVVFVGHTFDEWNQDMEPGLNGATVTAEIFDHERSLLGHDFGSLHQNNDREYCHHQRHIKTHNVLHAELRCSMRCA